MAEHLTPVSAEQRQVLGSRSGCPDVEIFWARGHFDEGSDAVVGRAQRGSAQLPRGDFGFTRLGCRE
ncbi:hypothetical protein [Leucobacter sp.]